MKESVEQKAKWLKKLDRIEAAAKGSPFQRLAFDVGAYLTGVGYHRLVYAFTKQSWKSSTKTFFDLSMQLLLPAGLDIYLLSAKTHDSEIRLARYMIRHLAQGIDVLDVGAHFGFFSLLAARLTGPDGTVLAIEATSSTFDILSENLSGISQAQALHLAAAEQSGLIKFYEFPTLYSEYNTTDPVQYEQAAKSAGVTARIVEVSSIPLDALITEKKLNPVFIKMDVEGAEPLVLRGAIEWLKQGSGVLAMEYLSSEQENTSHREAAELLYLYGWKSYKILGDGRLELCPDIESYLNQAKLDSDNIIFQTL